VAVYLQDGRQRRRSAATFRGAREIKIRAIAQEAARRAGPTLHSYALEWVDHYAGRVRMTSLTIARGASTAGC